MRMRVILTPEHLMETVGPELRALAAAMGQPDDLEAAARKLLRDLPRLGTEFVGDVEKHLAPDAMAAKWGTPTLSQAGRANSIDPADTALQKQAYAAIMVCQRLTAEERAMSERLANAAMHTPRKRADASAYAFTFAGDGLAR